MHQKLTFEIAYKFYENGKMLYGNFCDSPVFSIELKTESFLKSKNSKIGEPI
jgi:hypothetical protein